MCVLIERLTFVGYVMDFSDMVHQIHKVWKYSIGDMYLKSLSDQYYWGLADHDHVYVSEEEWRDMNSSSIDTITIL